jgi:sterol desaturase/sphingolipid hydroxylase (fatty acid hydroxylase superfamily)
MRLGFGGMAYLGADTAATHGYGLLNQLVIPDPLSIISTLLFLDFAIYCQHIASHKWPLLWRLHQVHHSDLEIDATTAVRFHPVEIMISMLYKLLCIFLIGANPWAVVAFEIMLNGAATFNHSNINIPEAIDEKLRWLFITPDMHLIHHSIVPDEANSNYGFSISCWDRLFNTYRAKSRPAQTSIVLGLSAFRKSNELNFLSLLRLPFNTPSKR